MNHIPTPPSQTTQTKPDSNPNPMKWPFKTLALAVIIPTVLTVLLICIALWYACYFRRQKRTHQYPDGNHRQLQRPVYGEQQVIPKGNNFVPVAPSPVDLDFHTDQELGGDKRNVIDKLEGRNGYEEDRVYIPVSVPVSVGVSMPTSVGSRSRSSSVSSMEEDNVRSIHVSKRRIREDRD